MISGLSETALIVGSDEDHGGVMCFWTVYFYLHLASIIHYSVHVERLVW